MVGGRRTKTYTQSLSQRLSLRSTTVTSYIITYNSCNGQANKTETLINGMSTTLPTSTYENKKFLGWYTEKDSGVCIGTAGEYYAPNSNITLYAHWE